MKTSKTILIILLGLWTFPGILSAQQNLEVEGKAKITVMDVVNTADSVVVHLPDGSLAVREVSTLTQYQVLSINKDTLFLTHAAFVLLPDADSTNEKISSLLIIGDSLLITEGPMTMKVPIDTSNTNELQSLSLHSDSLELSLGGGKIKLDTSNTNEMISQFVIDGDSLVLTEGSIIMKIPVDTSNINELQTLSIFNDTLFLSPGDTVLLPEDLNAGWTMNGDSVFTSKKVGIGTELPTANLDVVGTTELNGTTTINGTTNINGPTNINGLTSFYNGAVFNEGNGNYDFRVESDFNTHTLFVDASTDRVGIRTSVPSANLDVVGTTELNGLTRFYNEAVFNEGSGNYDFRVESDFNTHTLFVDASIDGVGIRTSNPSANLDVVGTTELNGSTTINGTTFVNGTSLFNTQNNPTSDFLVGNSATDYALFVDASTNQIGINTPGPLSTLDVNGSVSINRFQNPSFDFKVGSFNSQFALFVDAGIGKVGIGTSTPSTDLDVVGTTELNGNTWMLGSNMYIYGNTYIAAKPLFMTNSSYLPGTLSNGISLYAEDVYQGVFNPVDRSELRVNDESGNITTLSPHNFSLIGNRSEPMAWAFYSENDNGIINVDMLKAIRLIEAMSGEKLVHIESKTRSDIDHVDYKDYHFEKRMKTLETENNLLIQQNTALQNRVKELEEKWNILEQRMSEIEKK